MRTATAGLADEFARWATELDPSEDDLALARRSLLDTVGVLFAGRSHPLAEMFGQLGEAGRWVALAHVLDFDDLHLPSTTHISAVCVPVALSCVPAEWGARVDPARAYLAGAGVMARLGTALGWRHYSAGWHATCTEFSLEYGIAAALLDGPPGFDSFSDAAVRRPDAVRLMGTVEVAATDGGDHLLTGDVAIEIDGDEQRRATLALPPGAPERPMTDEELGAKLELCGAAELADLTWESAVRLVRSL